MCKAESEPGGPRRCSSDARTRYSKACDEVTRCAELERELTEILHMAHAGLVPSSSRLWRAQDYPGEEIWFSNEAAAREFAADQNTEAATRSGSAEALSEFDAASPWTVESERVFVLPASMNGLGEGCGTGCEGSWTISDSPGEYSGIFGSSAAAQKYADFVNKQANASRDPLTEDQWEKDFHEEYQWAIRALEVRSGPFDGGP